MVSFITQARAATYTVSSAADVADRLDGTDSPQAVYGDELVWSDGTYASQGIMLAGVDGITLRAETPGGVILTGDSYLRIGSDDSTFSGFEFQIDDPVDPAAPNALYYLTDLIRFRAEDNDDHAYNSRVSNCRVVDLRTGTSYLGGHHWVMFYGRGNQVDNCSFIGKRSEKSLIVITHYVETGGSDRGGEHTIINNYFGDRPTLNPADSNDNEWEIIRLGDSSSVCLDTATIVADNLFEECDGELETVSNKSSGNFILGNTFRDTEGQITIRQGENCLIEGNYFLGTGSSYEGGIRVTGDGHTVINNYFEALNGTGKRAAISLVAGQLNWDPGDDCISVSGYRPVTNTLIGHNTIVNCKRPFEFGADSSGTRNQAPSSVSLSNNAVYSTGSNSILTYSQTGSSIAYSGNVFYHTSGTSKLFSGVSPSYTSTQILFDNPDLADDATYGFYRPTSGSPLENAAQATVSAAALDILGNDRLASNRDVGAEEYWGATVTGANLRPLVASDVGCTWGPDAGPGPANPQTVVLNPVDDSYVRGGIHAGTNFGASDMNSLKVEISTVSDYDKRAYLKYNLSSVTGTVTSATFRIKIESMDSGAKNNLRPVVDDSWGEYSITWSNKPAYGSSMGTITLPGDEQWMEWDVTSFIAAEAAGDGAASFCILPLSTTTYLNAYYYSAEASSGNRPELVVTYE
ncbi:chondroitinase-B domain-containing protein [Cerasicoccus arenae]|uniref:Carbohydrate-binding module family 96 domain-containing protein n=1 Tax=Cerasicoccus arenae TaxID=424488 RepID=A0A8J3DI89_9BACT|nr:chondroitinase-B domain-containing protein [Cerasicoccus arenae]MBK1858849.1 polysaccharide lyase 6 family protein [Cerasicoccus arenae]GHB96028.1 hypothetical protein GCM10007047_09690 [Cerasicoccus arenae]